VKIPITPSLCTYLPLCVQISISCAFFFNQISGSHTDNSGPDIHNKEKERNDRKKLQIAIDDSNVKVIAEKAQSSAVIL
jgi:hypothetical protein